MACRDYWAKYEFDAHVSSTANIHDTGAAVVLALAEAERLIGQPLIDYAIVNAETGEIEPVVASVMDNGGRFRSFMFELFIRGRPELGLSGRRCVGAGGFHYWVVLSNRPAKVIAKVLRDAFQHMPHACPAAAGGVKRPRHQIQGLQRRDLVREMSTGERLGDTAR